MFTLFHICIVYIVVRNTYIFHISLFLFEAPCPDVYRGKYRATDYVNEDLGAKYAEDVKQICKDIKAQGRGVCAYIAESLISVGGQILPPQNYFQNVYRYIRNYFIITYM